MKKTLIGIIISSCILSGCGDRTVNNTSADTSKYTNSFNKIEYTTDNVSISEQDEEDIVSMNGSNINDENFEEKHYENIENEIEDNKKIEEEKMESTIDFNSTVSENSLSDNETEYDLKSEIWNNIKQSDAWGRYCNSQYYNENSDWAFLDTGEYISITSSNNDILTEIIYYDNTVDIHVTNLLTNEEEII